MSDVIRNQRRVLDAAGLEALIGALVDRPAFVAEVTSAGFALCERDALELGVEREEVLSHGRPESCHARPRIPPR